MPDPTPRAATVGEIARQAGCPTWQVQYVVRTRGLEPSVRAGNLRIFGDSDVQFVLSELRRIRAERGQEVVNA